MSEEVVDFETKIKSIKEKLEKLSSSELTLKESVELYKNGMAEIEEASAILANAKLEFETLSKGSN